MKKIDSRKIIWYKAGKLYMYVDNEYQYVILLKGWLLWWTTLQMEHSKDPRTDEAEYLVSCFSFFIICDVCFNLEYFSEKRFPVGTQRIHHAGWPSKRSTPKMHWRMTLQLVMSKWQSDQHIDIRLYCLTTDETNTCRFKKI